jgi:SAM-dependent methyltransferase
MQLHRVRRLADLAMPQTLREAAATVRQTAGAAAPDRARALARYGAMAGSYELRTASGDPWRRDLVTRLSPARGETILDVGCGTGRNFTQIMQRIGPEGRLVGVEQCPEMLAQARARVQRHGWTNVELVCESAEHAAIPVTADAVLLCAVHDVMRSPAALANVLGHLREGGRVVAGGPKWAAWRQPGAISVNLSTWRLNRDCVSTFEGFQEPWSMLAELVPGLRIEEVYLGAGYIACGAPVARTVTPPPADRRGGRSARPAARRADAR